MEIKLTKLIIFDLDGTLVDTVPDLAYCINQVMLELGYPIQESQVVISHMGNGLHRLISDILAEITGRTPDTKINQRAYDLLLNSYKHNFTSRSCLYPNAIETLSELKNRNVSLACVTNKLNMFTTPIIEYFKIHQFFSLILAGDSLKQKKPNPFPLLHACEQLGIKCAESIMVGDSETDVTAAQRANMRSVYMRYGYGNNSKVNDFKPDYSFESLQQLLELV